jgi:hypothetical protein
MKTLTNTPIYQKPLVAYQNHDSCWCPYEFQLLYRHAAFSREFTVNNFFFKFRKYTCKVPYMLWDQSQMTGFESETFSDVRIC